MFFKNSQANVWYLEILLYICGDVLWRYLYKMFKFGRLLRQPSVKIAAFFVISR